MGIYLKLFSILIAFPMCLAGSETSSILYLLQSGNSGIAIEQYQKYRQQKGSHDLELLQQMGQVILEQGSKSKDSEILIMTLFGASISMNDNVQYILEGALQYPDPRIQLIAMNLLSKFNNDAVDELINRTMNSPYVIIRAQGAFHLAEKKHPKAFGQIDSLMQKVPPEVLPAFPELYALLGTNNAIKALQRLLINANQDVRIEAILSAAKYERDDLLPDIRRLANHHNSAHQEACAVALGIFKDESSVKKLMELTQSTSSSVRLAAFQALYRLGREEMRWKIEDLAKDENLFAIHLLGTMPGSEPVLRSLLRSNNIQTRINTVISLLELKDPACWPAINEVLVRDPRGLAFLPSSTQGKGLSAWKVIPSAHHQLKDTPEALEVSIRLRETLLEKALDLPEPIFLQIASTVFDTRQDDLVPAVIMLLENLQTPSAIALIKKYKDQIGAPLIRNYCNLALFKLREEGPYEEAVHAWISSQLMHHLINFRTVLAKNPISADPSLFHLTPQETSRLLIESFEAYMQRRSDQGIDLLLHAIQYGNSKNRYALAGLLILAAE